MRKFTLILFCFLVHFFSSAQTGGNGWINFSQQYFKFPIPKEGLYRIDSTTLSSYFNLSSTDPRNFQLFIKGTEQHLHIEGEADGKINSGDYLEFYANNLMGEVDSLIYTHIKYTPNPYVALFNDTVYGFLTLTTSFGNKRFILETDTNSALYPAVSYVYKENVSALNNIYNSVEEYIQGAPGDPRYTQAEGKGYYLAGGFTAPINFGPLPVYTTSPLSARVLFNASGASKNFSSVGNDHHLRLSYSDAAGNPVVLFDTLFYGYAPIRKSFELNSLTLGANSSFSLASLISPSVSVSSNASVLHYLKFTYPQQLNFLNTSFYRFYAEDSPGAAKSLYNFFNFNVGTSQQVLLLDLSNGKRITTVLNPPFIRAVVPNGNGLKNCVLVAEKDTIVIKKLIPVNANGYFNNFTSQVTGKPFVMIYHKSLESSAQAYRNYRSSAAGGAYNVVFAEIQELYEQFAFGINKHPVAIRNFLKHLSDSLSTPPRFVLLIGKGMQLETISPAQQNENLIPTMGIPSSDHLLSASLGSASGNYLAPDIPIGRLAALSNDEVNHYLSKVQQHESSPQEDWKKQVLHFIGSTNDAELNTFSFFMDTYSQTIQDTLFGARVSTFKKNTTSPIQTDLNDSIVKAMSKGAALINFFGHGATQNLGMAIEDPNKFNNQGRYSFFIANSCYSGNVFLHGVQNSVSHNYVFANQRGSIGYIATTSESYDSRLHQFSRTFYKAFSNSHYNNAIGEVIKKAIQDNTGSADSLTKFIGLQEVLHGDPSLKIGNGDVPDYILGNSDVKFDLKTYTDSIGIRLNYLNLGKALADSVVLRVSRLFPNADTALYLHKIRAPYYADSLKFFVPLDFNRGIGLNKFSVKIDEYNEITESNENNNATSGDIDLLISGNDLTPVYPFPFAIVPLSNAITLKASTADPFAPEGDYIFQLDTAGTFTSPLQSIKMKSKGGVLEWTVNLPYKDSTVYFWRVSRDSTGPQNSFLWKESSFQTIGTKRGWAQAHFNQFKTDKFQYISQNKTKRLFEFQKSLNAIFCRTGNVPPLAPENINFYFNGIKMSEWGCGPNGWNFVVFDSISGQPQVVKSNPVVNTPGLYNNCICFSTDQYFYSFGANNFCSLTNWKTDMENFLNSIPTNQYVLAYSIGLLGGNAQVSTYAASLQNAFKSFGANLALSAADSLPRIVFGKKGMLQGQAHETIGPNYSNAVTQNDSISTRWFNGMIASEKVGPAKYWGSLHWRIKNLEALDGDSTVIKLVGITSNGSADTLFSFNQNQGDIADLQNYILAQNHPYLQLVAFMKDGKYRTAPQIERWQVIYEEGGECALNPLKGFKALNDTLMQGDEVGFVVPIENIGQTTFSDSLLITYWLEDDKLNQIAL
ncbi:MAG: C25 family cysteine peptidase [Bacteroidia bacterium]|nr:C25 family cysteine peptidase [Bacteroidia bacterium]